ncbi:hypothetical protein ACFWM7_32175 [Streptomyces sp. NPDC058375]
MIRPAELLMAGTPHDADVVQAEIDVQYRAQSEYQRDAIVTYTMTRPD